MGRVLFRALVLMAIAVHVGQWRLRKDLADGLCARAAPRRGPVPRPQVAVPVCRFTSRNPSVVADGRWVFRPIAVEPVPVVRSRLREKARAWIEQALPQIGLRGLALAVWLGDASGLPEGLARLYLEAGLLHLLALSGQHVASLWLLLHAVLALSAAWANRRAWRRCIYRWIHSNLALGAAGLLVLVNPGNEPMARSAAMLAALRVLRARRLRASPLQVVCSSLALLLVCSPQRVASDSFLLSAVATVLLCIWLQDEGRRSLFSAYCSLSFAMPILLLPVSAFFFGQVAWTAPVNGLVLGWVWSLVWVPLGFALPLVAVMPFLLPPLEVAWAWFAASNLWAAPWVAAGFQTVWRPTWWETAALEGLCVALVFGIRNAWRRGRVTQE